MTTKKAPRVAKLGDNLSIFDKAEQHGRAKKDGDIAIWNLAKDASKSMWGDNPEFKWSSDSNTANEEHVKACAKLASRFGVGAGGKAGESSEKAYSDKLRNWCRQEVYGKLDTIESVVNAYIKKVPAKADRNGKGFVDIALSISSAARKDSKLAIDSDLAAEKCKVKAGTSPTTSKDPADQARKAFVASIKAMNDAKLIKGKAKAKLDELLALLKVAL